MIVCFYFCFNHTHCILLSCKDSTHVSTKASRRKEKKKTRLDELNFASLPKPELNSGSLPCPPVLANPSTWRLLECCRSTASWQDPEVAIAPNTSIAAMRQGLQGQRRLWALGSNGIGGLPFGEVSHPTRTRGSSHFQTTDSAPNLQENHQTSGKQPHFLTLITPRNRQRMTPVHALKPTEHGKLRGSSKLKFTQAAATLSCGLRLPFPLPLPLNANLRIPETHSPRGHPHYWKYHGHQASEKKPYIYIISHDPSDPQRLE